MIEKHCTSNRLRYLVPTPGDLLFVASIYENPLMMAHLGGVLQRDRIHTMLEKWILHWSKRGFGICILVEKATSQKIGVAGIQIRTIDGEEVPDIGWMILPEFQGKGYASEAARTLLESGVGQQGLREIVAWPDTGNFRSIGILKKLGFKHERDAELPFMDKILKSSVWKYRN